MDKIFSGFRLIETPFLVDYKKEQYRFSRSKKKRIIKKFAKKYSRTIEVPSQSVIFMQERNVVAVHPEVSPMLIKAINERLDRDIEEMVRNVF